LSYPLTCQSGCLREHWKQHAGLNGEYRILREAIGQVITVEQISDHDLMVITVPFTVGFKKLAVDWHQQPLMVRSKIQIALVGRDGIVEGFKL
jgi:hypothetical protein